MSSRVSPSKYLVDAASERDAAVRVSRILFALQLRFDTSLGIMYDHRPNPGREQCLGQKK